MTHKATETESKPATEKELEVEPQKEIVTEKPKQVDIGVTTEKPAVRVYKEPPPFPVRFRLEKKQQEEKELLKLFGKIEINIPLIEAIKTVPRYAKFLKDLCTTKRKLRGTECVNLNEQVSAMFSKKALPERCTDPGALEKHGVVKKNEKGKYVVIPEAGEDTAEEEAPDTDNEPDSSDAEKTRGAPQVKCDIDHSEVCRDCSLEEIAYKLELLEETNRKLLALLERQPK
ncbi:hypothetical protein M569_10985 [Genlisea aurea]|uniref:Retrotransposon gag protein n=1 Tax=Genlisea aurea TaxID=192259 RepID=S8CA54_9LAMI|nr:hypothetical protein M569_10985 [Genlisea aurea]